MSNFLWPHGLQHASLPCPSLSPRICSDSFPLSRWWHPSHLILCHPLLFLPSIFPRIRVFSDELTLHQVAKYCSLFQHQAFQWIFMTDFLRIDWFDFLAVQETLKSLLQDDNLKASILQCPAFFMAQLSHPYMATGKTIALNVWTYVGKMMSLLFNTLSRFITFLPRSKCLLISWLQSLSTVTLEPNKIKPLTVSIFLPIYLPWSYLLLKDQ